MSFFKNLVKFLHLEPPFFSGEKMFFFLSDAPKTKLEKVIFLPVKLKLRPKMTVIYNFYLGTCYAKDLRVSDNWCESNCRGGEHQACRPDSTDQYCTCSDISSTEKINTQGTRIDFNSYSLLKII